MVVMEREFLFKKLRWNDRFMIAVIGGGKRVLVEILSLYSLRLCVDAMAIGFWFVVGPGVKSRKAVKSIHGLFITLPRIK